MMIADYILHNGPVSPFQLETVFNISNATLNDLLSTEKHVFKTKVGMFMHTYTQLKQRAINLLKTQWSIPVHTLGTSATTAECLAYFTLAQKDTNDQLFVFKINSLLHIKQWSRYNICDRASLYRTACKQQFAGLNLEEVYAEYDGAYTDVEDLVADNKLISTKTRAYAAPPQYTRTSV